MANCYCLGDPVNHVDPSGHISLPMLAKAIIKFLRLRHRPLPFTGTNGRMFMGSSLPRPSRQVAAVAPSPRPVTAPHSSIQTPQQALPAPALIETPSMVPAGVNASPPGPTGATHGRLLPDLPSVITINRLRQRAFCHVISQARCLERAAGLPNPRCQQTLQETQHHRRTIPLPAPPSPTWSNVHGV